MLSAVGIYAAFEFRYVSKVQQQSHFECCRSEIMQKLCHMCLAKYRGRFEFDDHFILDDKIRPVMTDSYTSVIDGDLFLLLNLQASPR
jgi:hypothetical protein